MKKVLSNKFANYFIVLFLWACTHALIYRSTLYLGQDLDVSTLLTLWSVSLIGHWYNFKYSFRQMCSIYVGMYCSEGHL